jgi:hypothetical protein
VVTFLEKFDELIAGKTAGEWLAVSDWDKYAIASGDIDIVTTDNRLYRVPGRKHGASRENAAFIAFVGTHAELIRDALKAHVDYFSLRGGYPKSPALVDEKKKAMHAAFEALDNAILSKSEQRRLAVQRGAKDEAVK